MWFEDTWAMDAINCGSSTEWIVSTHNKANKLSLTLSWLMTGTVRFILCERSRKVDTRHKLYWKMGKRAGLEIYVP